MGSAHTVPITSTEFYKGVEVDYIKFSAYRKTPTLLEVSPSTGFESAPDHYSPKPWLEMLGTDTLKSYHEFFDPVMNRRVVLVGEQHGEARAGARNWKRYDEYEGHPTNEVLIRFLASKKDRAIRSIFFLELPVDPKNVTITFTGGAIFLPDKSRRVTRANPQRYKVSEKFDPFVLVDEEPKVSLQNLDYLGQQLERHKREMYGVDIRDTFMGFTEISFLYYPEYFLSRSYGPLHSKTMEGAIERYKLTMHFLLDIINDVHLRLQEAYGSFNVLVGANRRLHALFVFFVQKVALAFKDFLDIGKQTPEDIRAKFKDFRALDIVTISRLMYVSDLVTRLMDFYTLGQIVNLPGNTLTVVYAGSAHTSYIARVLMLRGLSFELDHVGVMYDDGTFEIEDNNETEVIRAMHYLYREYADSQTKAVADPTDPAQYYESEETNMKNIGVTRSAHKFPDFFFIAPHRIFDDDELTRRVLEFGKKKYRRRVTP